MSDNAEKSTVDPVLAQRWEHDPLSALDELGHIPKSQDSAQALVRDYGHTAKSMAALHLRLEQHIRMLQGSRRLGGWWHRFSGAQLAREVAFEGFVQDAANTSNTCDSQLRHLREIRVSLLSQLPELRAQTQALHAKAKTAGHLLGDPSRGATIRQTLGEDQWLRLTQRVDDANVLSDAMEKTAAQCEQALEQIRFLEERFTDIQKFFLPIWRQRLGVAQVNETQREDIASRLDGLQWRTRLVALMAVGILPFAWVTTQLALTLWHRVWLVGTNTIDIPPDLFEAAPFLSLHSLFWLLASVPLGLVLFDRSSRGWQRTLMAACVVAVVGVVALTKNMSYATRPLHVGSSQLERDIADKQWARVLPYLTSLANPVAMPGDVARFEREKSSRGLDDGDRAYLRMANAWAAAQYVMAQIGLLNPDQHPLLLAHGEQLLQVTDNYFYSLGVDHADIGKLGALAYGNLRADVITRIDIALHGSPTSAIGISHQNAVLRQTALPAPTGIAQSALWSAVAVAMAAACLLLFATYLAWQMLGRSRAVATYLQ